MKSLRRFVTLLVCLLLVCTASSALAATKKPSKTFTTVPTLKFTDTPSGMDNTELDNLSISANVPGFLTLHLLDESGNVVITIAENEEIHSKVNLIDFYVNADDGEIIPEGTYTFSASMVSQFGVESKTVTKNTKVREYEEKSSSKKTETSKKTESTKTASKSDSSAKDDTSKSSAKETAKATAKPKATATPVPSEELKYAAGESKMGDEGLLIGVGVSDSAVQTDAGYWSLSADATDEEIWKAITRKLVGVDVGENESAYIYDSPESGREKLGTVSGISQGLNVIVQRDDGWSLVEAFRNEDGAFIRGYIRSDKLRESEPNAHYGIVIDKAKQTLTVFKDGQRLGSCQVTTGLPTTKYPHRETPAGEFIMVTRRGSYEYYGKGYTKYTIRINGSYYLSEIPTTKKNGTTFISDVESALGEKGTRGNICIAHDASSDGGINAEWIWNMTDDNKKVKVLIFDDKPRTDVPVTAN